MPFAMRRITAFLRRGCSSPALAIYPTFGLVRRSTPSRALASKSEDTSSAPPIPSIHKLNREAAASPSDAILSPSDYHSLADGALEELSLLCDCLQEAVTDEEVDVSLSQGVLNINVGSRGFWVVNKQSPNQQLWLSSPVSGPKRFEYSYNSEIGSVRVDALPMRLCANWRCTRSGEALLAVLQRELLEKVGLDITKSG